MNALTREEFLEDLCPGVRPIIAAVMECECGCEALDLLYNRPRTWLETTDIAYHLGQPVDKTIATLERLHYFLVLNRRDIFGIAFFHLTENQEILQALDQYWTWREVWRSRWQQTQDTLKL